MGAREVTMTDKEDKLYTVNQQKLIYLFFTIVTTTNYIKLI